MSGFNNGSEGGGRNPHHGLIPALKYPVPRCTLLLDRQDQRPNSVIERIVCVGMGSVYIAVIGRLTHFRLRSHLTENPSLSTPIPPQFQEDRPIREPLSVLLPKPHSLNISISYMLSTYRSLMLFPIVTSTHPTTLSLQRFINVQS